MSDIRMVESGRHVDEDGTEVIEYEAARYCENDANNDLLNQWANLWYGMMGNPFFATMLSENMQCQCGKREQQ